MSTNGKLFVVGFGPGNFEHITNGPSKPFKKVTTSLVIKLMLNSFRTANRSNDR